MDNFREVYDREFSYVWHICFAYMKNSSEAEDALQETFLRYMKYCKKKNKAFASENEEIMIKKIRSWLIVTAGNVCKDQLKSWWRKREPIDDYEHIQVSDAYEPDYVLEAVMELPDKYKIPVYMYYYMGYNSAEIAKELHMSASSVRTILSRARQRLKDKLTDNHDNVMEGDVNYEQ